MDGVKDEDGRLIITSTKTSANVLYSQEADNFAHLWHYELTGRHKLLNYLVIKMVSKLLKDLFIGIAAILIAYLLLPIAFLIFILPLLVWRKIVLTTARMRDPTMIPLSLNSQHTACDKMYTKPNCGVLTTLLLEDKIPIDKFRQRVSDFCDSGKVCALMNEYLSISFPKRFFLQFSDPN